jgi:phenylacetate-CoA ligase
MPPGNDFSNIDGCPAATLGKLQDRLLREHISYCMASSPYYRKRLKNVATAIEDIDGHSLQQLPFTRKSDIEQANDRFLAVAPDRIADIVLSSGTTGKPTRIQYTQNDLKRIAACEARALTGCGVTAADRVLLTCTMDRCFVAGLAYYSGLQRIGAAAIRGGQGTLEGHMALIRRLRPHYLIGVPSFLVRLGVFVQRRWGESSAPMIKGIVCIGEAVRDRAFRPLKPAADLAALWGAPVFSTYASSEAVTPFCECTAGMGGHLLPDMAILEIVDEQGRRLPAGKIGEIVLTPLKIEGMPLVRFRTGDISFREDEHCSCGRTAPRLGPILGRKQQMMKVRGTTFYPQMVFSVLDQLAGLEDYYLVAEGGGDAAEKLIVFAAIADADIDKDHIRRLLQAELRVKPEVIICSVEHIQKTVMAPQQRKPIRFFDQRQMLR